MKHKKFGFTLIEVSLFLAITGLLFVGIAIGTGNSIAQQRFFDSVQNFAEFMRSVYSEVSNPQSVGNGRSEYAIYGRLVSFGEEYDLNGEKNEDGKVYVYDVVGKADVGISGDIVSLLGEEEAEANVFIANSDGGYGFAGITDEYLPRWGAKINNDIDGQPFAGAVMVVRHPRSGTITTLVYNNGSLNVNETKKNNGSFPKNFLTDKLESFNDTEINFCVNPNGDRAQDVRLAANARNASGVEIVNMDSDENQCKK